MTVELSNEEEDLLRQAAGRLVHKFRGKLAPETVDRVVADSLERLADGAAVTRVTRAERFADQRLRAMARLQSEPGLLNPSVLFLCVHNAGRSQMAAGFMRWLSEGRVDVFSGGSEPAGQINHNAVEVMLEMGIDITGELPQPWSDEIVRTVDVVVTMGCGDACPIYPGKRYVDWQVDDPAGKVLDEIRPIRDDLEQRVRGLLDDLTIEPVR